MKRWLLVACMAASVVGTGLAAAARLPSARGAKGSKGKSSAQRVTICHALGNGGYVRISPSVSGVLKGHAGHQDDRDIIPPFDYTLPGGKRHFDGLNYSTSSEKKFLKDGCVPSPDSAAVVPYLGSCVLSADRSSYSATFGYQSGKKKITIPVGADNHVELVLPQPQPNPPPVVAPPTVFQKGGDQQALTITLPADATLTWTVASGGLTTTMTVTASDCSPTVANIGLAVCVTKHSDGTFDATFGYESGAAENLTIPVGAENGFLPAPRSRGQPTTFAPGIHPNAFTVTDIPAGQNLVWVVQSAQTVAVTASADDDLCQPAPQPTSGSGGSGPGGSGSSGQQMPLKPSGIFVTCVANHGSTYDAVFGYENNNNSTKTVPLGEGNAFIPARSGSAPPTVFVPGRVEEAVKVTGIPASSPITWRLATRGTLTATATASEAPKCSQAELMTAPTGAHPGSGSSQPPGTQPPSPAGPEPPDPPGVQPLSLPRASGMFAACVINHRRTYDAAFGYLNKNIGAVVIPIGLNNKVSPGPADQGQPETFAPGFVGIAFTIHGISDSTPVTWTLRYRGLVRSTTATPTLKSKCLSSALSPVADLALTKSVSPRAVKVGADVRFMITVRKHWQLRG